MLKNGLQGSLATQENSLPQGLAAQLAENGLQGWGPGVAMQSILGVGHSASVCHSLSGYDRDPSIPSGRSTKCGQLWDWIPTCQTELRRRPSIQYRRRPGKLHVPN